MASICICLNEKGHYMEPGRKNHMETKRDKFIRLAEARTNKILKMIELLGNLSNKSTYEYSEDDISRIYERINDELSLSRERFGFGLRSKPEAFTLTEKNMINITEECVEAEDVKLLG